MDKICPECRGDGVVSIPCPGYHYVIVRASCLVNHLGECANCGGEGIINVKFQISKEKSDVYLPTPWRVEDPNGNINWEATFDHAVVRMDLMAGALFGKQEAA